VSAVVVPSLAHTTNIVIDTRQDPVPCITNITFDERIMNDSRVIYSAGDRITLTVTFSQEVLVSIDPSVNSSKPVLPSIELNITRRDSEDSVWATAILLDEEPWKLSRVLRFMYVVELEDYQFPIRYFENSTIQLNNFFILDGWRRPAQLHLPPCIPSCHASLLRDIGVDSSRARITGVSTNRPSGEYAAGDVVTFQLNFSRKVR